MLPPLKVHRLAYFGLFAVTLATLMFENLLTRIFSVTMWYHFAFMAVSIALFGMTMGAIIVYLFPGRFTQERVKTHLVTSALLFSLTTAISFVIHLNTPLEGEKVRSSLLFTYLLIALPFVFAGINTCLMLTKFPGQVGKLYAADLGGAALGCILFIYVLKITDGPTAVFITALIASTGALFYAFESGERRLKQVTSLVNILFLGFVGVQMILVSNQQSLVRLKWVKGGFEETPLIEKWNSFSRVRVGGDQNKPVPPFGWGMSSVYPKDRLTNYLLLDIDSTAITSISAFDGDFDKVDYLKYDITNLVHYIRPDADVLVVGVGGGRDVLSALAFEQRSVTGVEINENIIEILTKTYGDFSGNLDQLPGVTFVNDEARSYIARSQHMYDIIQVSLIDTWAATASGAFVLTENSLYTLEAWDTFFEHLTPNGVVSFSRWYYKDMPGEMYRLTTLASKALELQGVENPREHLLIVGYNMETGGADEPNGIGTLLVSKEPFSSEDLRTIEKISQDLLFDPLLTPEYAIDSSFEQIASGIHTDTFIAAFPLNIAPPTDNSPFFFHMLRLRDIFNLDDYDQGVMSFNVHAVYILGGLLIIVFLLSLLSIAIPLLLTDKKLAKLKTQHAFPLSVFFAAIGLGFMMIEISQLQRLTVFLGHPTYSLSVVLFSLLLSSGLGSYLTQKVQGKVIHAAIIRLSILLCVIGLFGLVTPPMIRTFAGAVTPVRILLAVLVLFPMGLFMGMAFPMGMKIALAKAQPLAPWFWGVNGAMSVLASVLTVALSINSGISASFWAGFGCYAVALVSILGTRKSDVTDA
ncbi:MAG: hypothetical protein ACOYYS_00430 [Chloroflexota bacterium]